MADFLKMSDAEIADYVAKSKADASVAPPAEQQGRPKSPLDRFLPKRMSSARTERRDTVSSASKSSPLAANHGVAAGVSPTRSHFSETFELSTAAERGCTSDRPETRQAGEQSPGRAIPKRTNSFLKELPDIDLRHVLEGKTKHPVTIAEYKEYLEKVEFGSEILDFWLAVQQAMNTTEDADRRTVIESIIDTYIKAGSPKEINIAHNTRTKILAVAKRDSRDATELQNAVTHCYELMRTGSFPRFLYKVTYSNIGDEVVDDRRNMAIFGAILCLIWIPLALTQPWFKRSSRFALFLPIFWTVACSQQWSDGFCVTYAALGRQSDKTTRIECSLAQNPDASGKSKISRLLAKFRRSKEDIEEPCVRKAQRHRAIILLLCFYLPVSIALTFIVWAIPLNVK